AISFAGEDRPQAERIAKALKKAGVRVFYDQYEQASLLVLVIEDTHTSFLQRLGNSPQAERIAKALKKAGVRVFYDQYEQGRLFVLVIEDTHTSFLQRLGNSLRLRPVFSRKGDR